ncbi:glycosyltransferase [Marininema halotolerans]|uniref:Glycosyl transferases group 1 n=1 Tax=Marininema halotolerans TaxID=1155944 RepID=A0A1I6R7X5_9BACL|nr:hypothetical protein [Marininema halotolerans]SFS60804.1 hypothetical protein SAMN05444972_104237 [Marininema halotolerans]
MKIWILPDKKSLLSYLPTMIQGEEKPTIEQMFYRDRDEGENQSLAAFVATISRLQGKGLSLHWVGDIDNDSPWKNHLTDPLILYLDSLPKVVAPPFSKAAKVVVPSYYLKERMERGGLFPPETLERLQPMLSPDTPSILRQGSSNKKPRQRRRLLVIEEYVTNHERQRLQRCVRTVQKRGFPHFRMVTIPLIHLLQGRPIPPVHMVFTGGEASTSLSLFHLVLMNQGIPIITTDQGDRGEWVLHGHTGYLLGKKDTKKDWSYYLTSMVKDSTMRRDFAQNGHLLIAWLRDQQMKA